MVEGELLEAQLGRGVAGARQELVPFDGAVQWAGAEVRQQDDLLQRRHLGAEAGDDVAAVEVAAVVAVAVDGKEHLRLDLGEAVDHGARAEVR